jgi:hypothetical protein
VKDKIEARGLPISTDLFPVLLTRFVPIPLRMMTRKMEKHIHPRKKGALGDYKTCSEKVVLQYNRRK